VLTWLCPSLRPSLGLGKALDPDWKPCFVLPHLLCKCFITSTQNFWDGSDNAHLAATIVLYLRTIWALEKAPLQDPPGVTGVRKWAMEQNSKGDPLHLHLCTQSSGGCDFLPLLQLPSDTPLKTCSRLCRQLLQLALLKYLWRIDVHSRGSSTRCPPELSAEPKARFFVQNRKKTTDPKRFTGAFYCYSHYNDERGLGREENFKLWKKISP